MPVSTHFVTSALARLKRARKVADDVKQDEILHRLAMRAVFVLEDCYEALLQEAGTSTLQPHSEPSEAPDQAEAWATIAGLNR